jgi:hypothetical protein
VEQRKRERGQAVEARLEYANDVAAPARDEVHIVAAHACALVCIASYSGNFPVRHFHPFYVEGRLMRNTSLRANLFVLAVLSSPIVVSANTQTDGVQGMRKPLVAAAEGVQGMRKPLVAAAEGVQGMRKPLIAAAEGVQGMRKPLIARIDGVQGMRKPLSA